MSNNLYDILWVNKNSTTDEIKKAYRKKAMQYHPDRNKWDSNAETKFKEVNQAYDTLWDASKKKQYDTFWSTWWNPFWWWAGNSWNPFWWWAGWFSWFEDIFWWMWWNRGWAWWASWFSWFEDIFWWMWWQSKQKSQYSEKKKPESLDFEKVYEVPIFDLILWCKIEVKWVYWNIAKLKIPASTKSWSKFRVKGFWKKEPWKEGNLIVKVEWIMPKNISDVDLHMLERIRENIGY